MTAVVAGVGATRLARRSPAGEHALAAEAVARALADAKLRVEDVDGVVRFDRDAMWEYDLPGVLRTRALPFYAAVPFNAGSAPALLGLAQMAVATGRASVVVGWHARDGVARAGEGACGDVQRPLGVPTRVEAAATWLRWWLARRGLDEARTLAAWRRLVGYEAGRALATPLGARDVARPAVGGAAFVVTAGERAAPAARGVRIVAVAQAALPDVGRDLAACVDGTRERAMAAARRDLWRQARWRPGEVDAAFAHADPSPLGLVALVEWGLEPAALLHTRRRPAVSGDAGVDGMHAVLAAVRAIRRGDARRALVAGSPLEPTSAAVLEACA